METFLRVCSGYSGFARNLEHHQLPLDRALHLSANKDNRSPTTSIPALSDSSTAATVERTSPLSGSALQCACKPCRTCLSTSCRGKCDQSSLPTTRDPWHWRAWAVKSMQVSWCWRATVCWLTPGKYGKDPCDMDGVSLPHGTVAVGIGDQRFG